MRYYGKIENDYDLVNKKYVDNNAASIPTIPITAAMIIGTDPIEIQFSDEQFAILQGNDLVIIDGTAIGNDRYIFHIDRNNTNIKLNARAYSGTYFYNPLITCVAATKKGTYTIIDEKPITNGEIDTLFT